MAPYASLVNRWRRAARLEVGVDWDELGIHFEGRYVLPYEAGVGLPLTEGVAFMIEVDPHDPTGSQDLGRVFLRHLRALGREARASQIEALILRDWGGDGLDEESMADAEIVMSLMRLGRAGRLQGLKALMLGEFPVVADAWPTALMTDGFAPLTVFPGLEALHLNGRAGIWGPPRHERLKTLVMRLSDEPAEQLHLLSQGFLPSLEFLEVWLGGDLYLDDEGIYGAMGPLLSGQLLPRLRHLGLPNCGEALDVIEALVGSPLAATLEGLDLSHGGVTDDAAAMLTPATMPSLHRLVLDNCQLSPRGVEALSRGPWELVAGPQRLVERDEGPAQAFYW